MGNSVTTILHNNYSEKPLTPKSSNQKPTFKYELDFSSCESFTSVQKIQMVGCHAAMLSCCAHREHIAVGVNDCVGF